MDHNNHYNTIMKNYTLLLFLLLIVYFISQLSINALFQFVFAPPSVERQEIRDTLNDWRLTNNVNNRCNDIEKT